jgi:hypothetical protein
MSVSSSRQSYVASLGLPRGLESTFEGNLSSCDVRLVLIDNCASMLTRDAHRIGGHWGAIQRLDGATRWEEMQDCVAFCADMASRCWIPTKFCVSLVVLQWPVASLLGRHGHGN